MGLSLATKVIEYLLDHRVLVPRHAIVVFFKSPDVSHFIEIGSAPPIDMLNGRALCNAQDCDSRTYLKKRHIEGPRENNLCLRPHVRSRRAESPGTAHLKY